MTRWLIKNSRHYSQDPLIKKAIRVIYLVCRLLHTSPPRDDFFVLGMVLQVVFEWKGVGVLMVPGQNERLQKLAIWRSRIALQNKICMRIVRPAMTVCLSVCLWIWSIAVCGNDEGLTAGTVPSSTWDGHQCYEQWLQFAMEPITVATL